MPPVMPAPKFTPTAPRITAVPPVMYSQPFEPHALDHRVGAGVAHGEALAGPARGEQLARGGAVEDGVADDGVVLGHQRARDGRPAPRWCRPTGPCRHSRWRRRTLRASCRCTAKAPSDWPAVPRSRTVTVSGCSPAMPYLRVIMAASRVPTARWVFRTLYCSCIFSRCAEQRLGVADHLRVERVGHLVAALDRAVHRARAAVGAHQQRVEVEVVEIARRRG